LQRCAAPSRLSQLGRLPTGAASDLGLTTEGTMLQLHCPRCDYSLAVEPQSAEPRNCPECAAANVEVSLCATATIPVGGSARPQLAS
jgi:hypothetical protein